MKNIIFYKWDEDEYKEGGLKELKRIASSDFFSGCDEFIEIIDKYHKYYESNKYMIGNITAIDFYPEDALQNEKGVRDKVHNQIRKLRPFLSEFYDSDEGKNSKYIISFVAEKNDYRIKVKKRGENTEASDQNISSKISSSQEVFFDFLRIYTDVWRAFPFPCSVMKQIIMKARKILSIMRLSKLENNSELHKNALVHLFNQSNIINRVNNIRRIKIDAVLSLVFSLLIIVLFLENYISQVQRVSPNLYTAIIQSKLIAWLRMDVFYQIMSSAIFIILGVLFFAGALAFFLKRFGGKASYWEALNLTLYFYSAWVAVVFGVWITATPLKLQNSILFIFACWGMVIYAIISYITTLNKLMDISNKKGFFALLTFVLFCFVIIISKRFFTNFLL